MLGITAALVSTPATPAQDPPSAPAAPAIVPRPVSLETHPGEFAFAHDARILIDGGNAARSAALTAELRALATYLQQPATSSPSSR